MYLPDCLNDWLSSLFPNLTPAYILTNGHVTLTHGDLIFCPLINQQRSIAPGHVLWKALICCHIQRLWVYPEYRHCVMIRMSLHLLRYRVAYLNQIKRAEMITPANLPSIFKHNPIWVEYIIQSHLFAHLWLSRYIPDTVKSYYTQLVMCVEIQVIRQVDHILIYLDKVSTVMITHPMWTYVLL